MAVQDFRDRHSVCRLPFCVGGSRIGAVDYVASFGAVWSRCFRLFALIFKYLRQRVQIIDLLERQLMASGTARERWIPGIGH
jgi:hypothetical protein